MLAAMQIASVSIIFISLFGTSNQSESSIPSEDSSPKCMSDKIIKRFQLNPEIYKSCEQLASSHNSSETYVRIPRRVEPIFRGKPKPHAEVLAGKFHLNTNNEQTNSLVALVNKIATEYLRKCPPVIYYDSFVEKSDSLLLELLFKTFPFTYYHGEISSRYEARNKNLKLSNDANCMSFILFLSDPLMTRSIIGPQTENRVLVVSRSTQWKLKDFLSSDKSSDIVNLLVVGQSLSGDPAKERPYVLYTHKLYADGLGSNKPIVLTSWLNGGLTRPHINLYPKKFGNGFAGHRFQIIALNQPPYIFRIKTLDFSGVVQVHWDGIEYRLLQMVGEKLNFSIDIRDVPEMYQVQERPLALLEDSISTRLADIGMSGVYISPDRMDNVEFSVGHSKDCATFITLASKALPKYRAIMGPFQWPVWVALICIYLGGVFPIVFTDRLTLKHLLGNWGELENMFWYVFGMFTNSLTFSGRYAWGNTQKVSTRILIGSYWLFTIIITACYTGSIIAFVTLPAFPDTVDSVMDLLGLFFRVGTIDNGGWETWFQNSSHEATSRLFQKMEYVSSVNEGIGNVTQSFFWNYAFLGSRAQLKYLVQSNFSNENISRRSALHLSEECFALFYVGYMFPKNSVYKQKINSLILLAQQAGLLNKIENEVKWDMQRTSGGKLLQASSSSPLRESIQEERQLTTADTEGMFLLMGIGYAIGAIALISEIVGGITNKCRQIIRRSRKSISSAWSSKRSSVVAETGMIPRTEQEELIHAARQLERIKMAEEKRKNEGFRWRQFNLTRTTLRELYGDNNKSQSDNGSISHVHIPEPTINNSIHASESVLKENVINETHENEKCMNIQNNELEIAFKTFDSTLANYCNDENESDADNDDNDVEQEHIPIQEEEEKVFGSFVGGSVEQNPKILENLELFKEQ
ncbi:ionotropic receptor 21a [Stomoxys calcitrans]|uniref:ionotropic receptor 21a n=1 Tax=Stomoxys calcitrans TaxID=35570 RepID=UPI0027E395D0|nr:ionotropic receptor 21a [Stomoxys calcitrans]